MPGKYRITLWVKDKSFEGTYEAAESFDFIVDEQSEEPVKIIRVKDKYSSREFDCHSVIIVKVLRYIPASIDHVLFPLREYHMVGDKITLNVVTQNSKSVLMKYALKINNHKVEESDFVTEKGYAFTPKCSGNYTVEIFAKNIESDKPFDSKKEVKIDVHEILPVTNTKITCDKVKFMCNEHINFTVSSEGGKDIVYEFFLMEKGEWNLVQNYSKKDYYTFMPFSKDEYKILVLSKSQYNKDSYEDYDTFVFNIE
jgi:hypothetical protein